MIHEIPDKQRLPGVDGDGDRVHVFDEPSKWAIRAALGAGRPLLVRGDPGLGKTQLAEAAAQALNRQLITCVVNARTEAGDLLFTVDSVRRLAEAQLCSLSQLQPDNSASQGSRAAVDAVQAARQRLNAENFLVPGPIWWALAPASAATQAEKAQTPHLISPVDSGDGATREKKKEYPARVLLIDEIDKAESEVPNSLLEALGARKFTIPGLPKPITVDDQPPLIVITTNEERALPDAFLRRCVVLHLTLPGRFDDKGENPQLRQWLVARGRVHFSAEKMADAVLEQAADALLRGRYHAEQNALTPAPGQAEYLDLLRAVNSFYPQAADIENQRKVIHNVRQFLFQKHASSSVSGEADGDSP